MKSNMHKLMNINVAAALLILIFLSLGVVGCASTQNKRVEFQVIPIPNQQVAELGSDDIVRVMRRAGFSDEQIWELGAQLRDGLLRAGAVQISRNNIVEVQFAIRSDRVYVTARLRGSFVYDLKKKSWIKFGASSPESKTKRAPAAQSPNQYPQSTWKSLLDKQSQNKNVWQK